MRIDLSVPDPDFSRSSFSPATSPAENESFTGLLGNLLRTSPPNTTSDTIPAETVQQQLKTLDLRQESYLEAIYANQQTTEQLLETWKEHSPQAWLEDALEDELSEQTGDTTRETTEAELTDLADATDLTLEPDLSPGEYISFLASDGKNSDKSDPHPQQNQQSADPDLEIQSIQEQEMSYTEIQTLVDSILLSDQAFSYKIRRLLSRILQALAAGQHFNLDQQVFLELEASEWQMLATIFPPRFFQGLLRPLMHQQQTENLLKTAHNLIEHIFYQKGALRPEQLDQLEQWWSRITHLPDMFISWLRQPEIPTLSFSDLRYPIEILYQHQALLPGPTGRIQILALQYLHHPETAIHLFEISRTILHSQPLSQAQITLLSEKLAEFCFPRALFAEHQIAPLLQKALSGQELEHSEILQILQGTPQNILSHLPFGQLPTSLREIIHFIHTDPDWREDNILTLFMENEQQI